MNTEELNVNITISKSENKLIVTTSNRDGDLLLKKEITLQNENNFPIEFGARGIYVENIQEFIYAVNPKMLKTWGRDGIFGIETQRAVLTVFGEKSIDVKKYSMVENFLVSINKFKKP